MQKFTVKIGNVSKEFDKKVAVLDLLSEEQKADKSIVCAKVNNRIRELTYEIYYDAEVEFLDLKSTQLHPYLNQEQVHSHLDILKVNA